MEHKKVLEIFPDINPRTLINWSERGLFQPAVQPCGAGSRREYSAYNLFQIGVIRELRYYGVAYDSIREILSRIEAQVAEAHSFDFYFADMRSDDPFSCLMLDLGKIHKYICSFFNQEDSP